MGKIKDGKWKDKDVLVELYIEDRLSTREIGDKLGCDKNTILYWMDKYDIQRRDNVEAQVKARRKKPPSIRTDDQGYVTIKNQYGDEHYVTSVHRLLAVSEYGLDRVADNHVHHKNGIPWDNRPENIEVMDPSEHIALHHAQGDNPKTNHMAAMTNDTS